MFFSSLYVASITVLELHDLMQLYIVCFYMTHAATYVWPGYK